MSILNEHIETGVTLGDVWQVTNVYFMQPMVDCYKYIASSDALFEFEYNLGSRLEKANVCVKTAREITKDLNNIPIEQISSRRPWAAIKSAVQKHLNPLYEARWEITKDQVQGFVQLIMLVRKHPGMVSRYELPNRYQSLLRINIFMDKWNPNKSANEYPF